MKGKSVQIWSLYVLFVVIFYGCCQTSAFSICFDFSLSLLNCMSVLMILTIKIVEPEGKQMQLLLDVGGPDRVSRVQMAEAVVDFRGCNTPLIKAVSASSVCIAFKIYSLIF